MADTKLTALTEISVPALDDVLYGVDVSDTTDDPAGSSRKLTLARLLGLSLPCQGRLTTETGVPVSSSDRTSQSTLYFTPFTGGAVALYDGTRWKLYTFTERSLALSSLTSGLNYDVFLYDNAGTLTLELTAWTNDTTRATALTTQDGVLVKTGATTRRYLGTIRTTATNATEDSATKRFVWNFYNRVQRKLLKVNATASWSYGTHDTWRSANADDAQRVQVVIGVAGITVEIENLCGAYASTAGDAVYVGVGYDRNNGADCDLRVPVSVINTLFCKAQMQHIPAIGFHFYQAVELVDNGGSARNGNYYGTVAKLLSGLIGTVEG